MANRYMVFYGFEYYPCGGIKDLLSTHATKADALNAVSKLDDDYKWWHIYDTWTATIIHSYSDKERTSQ